MGIGNIFCFAYIIVQMIEFKPIASLLCISCHTLNDTFHHDMMARNYHFSNLKCFDGRVNHAGDSRDRDGCRSRGWYPVWENNWGRNRQSTHVVPFYLSKPEPD